MTTPEDFSNERFADYLRSLCDSDAPWWKTYAFIDEIDDATWFEFELNSKTQDKPKQPGEKPSEKTLLVLQAVEDYAHEKILIVGSPGAGKSTLLTRLLWQAAQKAQQNAKAPIPVLVELKLYGEGGIWELIQTSLENCNVYLEIPDIKKLVEHRRLLLLADGFNELPSDHARNEFRKFCGRNIPVIVTSRDGTDDLGLERKLQIQPLTNAKVKAFLQSRLPDHAQAQIKELGDRVKDFGQTPLMVWMLFSIFRQNGDIPTTRGEAYRTFTTLYAEKAKEGIDLDESRGLLSKLAFELMHAEKPTDFRLDISEVDAQDLVGSEKALKHLVRNHLLQAKGKLENRRISFCHQSLQEYYAAEALLVMLRDEHPDVKDDRLQHFYLNYLKWTEVVSIVLPMMEDKTQALKVVKPALEVDLQLGSQLAGEVKVALVKNALELLNDLGVSSKIRIRLLGRTHADAVIAILEAALEDPNLVWTSIYALEEIASVKATDTLFQAVQNNIVRNDNAYEAIIQSLAKTLSQDASDYLQQIVKDNTQHFVRALAARELGKFSGKDVIKTLFTAAVDDTDDYVSEKALGALYRIGSREAIEAMEEAEKILYGDHDDSLARSKASSTSSKSFERNKKTVVRHNLIPTEELQSHIHLMSMEDLQSYVHLVLKSGGIIDLLEQLEGSMHHQNADVRLKAIHALGEMRDRRSLDLLFRALSDSNFDNRANAAYTIGRFGDERAIPLLIQAFNQEENSPGAGSCVRLAIIDALGDISHSKALPFLENLIDNDESELFGVILEAIEKISSPESLRFLYERLSSRQELDVDVWMTKVTAIQKRCQFYNYTIAQQKLAPHTTERSLTNIIQGDCIAGDKIEGDKNIIDRVGIINTGDVTIQGNQNGETLNL